MQKKGYRKEYLTKEGWKWRQLEESDQAQVKAVIVKPTDYWWQWLCHHGKVSGQMSAVKVTASRARLKIGNLWCNCTQAILAN